MCWVNNPAKNFIGLAVIQYRYVTYALGRALKPFSKGNVSSLVTYTDRYKCVNL